MPMIPILGLPVVINDTAKRRVEIVVRRLAVLLGHGGNNAQPASPPLEQMTTTVRVYPSCHYPIP